MNWLSSAFRAIAEVFGFVNKRTDLKNAPDVRAAKVGQNETAARSAVEKTVATKDVAAIRQDLAE